MRCDEKRRFLSEAAAAFQYEQIRAVAKRSRKMQDGYKKRKSKTTQPYLCWKCGFWHLGSSRYIDVPSKYNKIVDADPITA